MKHLVGTIITLVDGKQRILRIDTKGFYVRKDNVRCYVEYCTRSKSIRTTGAWDHR